MHIAEKKYKKVALENLIFDSTILRTIFNLINVGKLVIAAGLDLDFLGYPFGIMPSLMAVADSLSKLNAICVSCGKDACYSQQVINGLPARSNSPLILIGAQELYQARCRDCFIIDAPMYQSCI